MDVKQYYKKRRELERSIAENYVFVVSLETADGGRPGIVSEVSREIAARLIVEGRAVLATDQEKECHLREQEATRKAAQKAELARRVQVAIIADPDFEDARSGKKSNEPNAQK